MHLSLNRGNLIQGGMLHGEFCITIAREYGSGGRLIGQQVARLNIAFYDRELIVLAPGKADLPGSSCRRWNRGLSALSIIYMTGYELPASEKIFLPNPRRFRRLRRRALRDNGQVADYVLRDKPNCFRVFIHAPIEERIKESGRSMGRPTNLEDYIRKQDKNRASYYNYYTHKKWGRAQNYHLCIDSSIGISTAVHMIKELVAEHTKR